VELYNSCNGPNWTNSSGEYYVLASNANNSGLDKLWEATEEPQFFTFTAHVAQNETTAGAGDGVVVIDSIYAGDLLSFEYSRDAGSSWKPVLQGDSITNLPADTLYFVLRTGEVYSDTLELIIEEGCKPITFTIADSTACGNLTGTIVINGLDPNRQYEYALIPKGQLGKPVITLLGDNPLTWTLGETFVDPGATAYDEKDGDITDDIVAVSTVDVNTVGTYQVSYNVTDIDGNAAVEVIRNVEVPQQQMSLTHTKQTSFTLSMGCSTYNTVTIQWGDGTSTVVANSNQVHTYAAAGTYTVTMTGDLSNITQFHCQGQQVTGISLSPLLENIESLSVNSNLFPSLVIPETCVKLNFISCFGNMTLTDFQPNQKLIAGRSINFYVSQTGIKHLYFPTTAGANTLINGTFNGMTELLTADFSGIEYMTSQSFLFIGDNKLTSISAPDLLVFTATSSGYSLNFSSLPELTTVSMPKCTDLTGSGTNSVCLNVPNCPKLTTFDFPKLSYIRGEINASACPLLTSLSFPALTSCTGINTQLCTSLTTLSFPKLVNGSPYITTCSPYGTESYPNLFTINFPVLSKIDYIRMRRTGASTISFPSLTIINGLDICYNNATSILLPELTDKIDVASSSNQFEINYNTSVQTIDLSKFKNCGTVAHNYIANLHIGNNNSLVNLHMSNLERVIGDLDVGDNPNMTSAIDLPYLTSITGAINIYRNYKIPSINLGSLTSMYGAMNVINNTLAASLSIGSSLSGMTSFAGYSSGYTSVSIPATCTALTSFRCYSCPYLTFINCAGGGWGN
jgi:PKD repeat protein